MKTRGSKLKLNRQTLRDASPDALRQAAGGQIVSLRLDCYFSNTHCGTCYCPPPATNP